MTMKYKVFFCDYCEDKVLESKGAKESTKEELLHIMGCVLHTPDNFIGIIDENDNTVQFMVNQDKSILVDIPDVEKNGSYSTTSTLEKCIDLVREIDGAIDYKKIGGMEFRSW